MLRNQRKGWIAPAALAALLLASVPAAAAGPAGPVPRDTGSWIVRLAGWLGLPPSLTAAWGLSSANIDPNGQPTTDDSAHIDPLGQPRSSSADSSGYIDPNS